MSRFTIHDSPFTTFAHALADAAGDVIRPYFGAHGDVEDKSDNSPVTLADKLAEKAMRALITAKFPEHGIYGEEFGIELVHATTHDSRLTAHAYTWVLDPIDGTRAFIAGRMEWGTLIALCENGIPILGILDQPITGERWVGISGQPTMYYSSSPPEGEQQCKTRPCPTLAHAELSTTSASYFTPTQAKHVVALAQACRATVKDGDCYAYGLLARGMRDVVIDAGLKPYDILALVPIIEGAGGKITGWDGQAVTLENYANVVAVGDSELLMQIYSEIRQT